MATDQQAAIAGSSHHVSFDDPVAAAIQLVDAVGEVEAVVGTDGAAVAVATEVARLIGRPTNPSAAIATASDKQRQREAAGAAGVSQPAFTVIGAGAYRWTTFPAVVKPLDRSASQGVVKVDSRAELDAGVVTVRQIVGSGSPLLVEEFVPGIEVAVDGLLQAGRLEVLAVFDKPDNPEGPTFPETLLISPARLEPDALPRVVAVVEQALAAVGLVEGPVHVECKIDGSKVRFLELAARTIGGLCSRALAGDGTTLEAHVVRHALGMTLPSRRPAGATGVLMLPVPATGRLAAVRGVETARAVEHVTDVVISVGPGQHVVALPEGDRYLGFVFARADHPDAVEAALRTAWAALDVDIIAS